MNYYNEWDKPTAAWLRELIERGLIPKGDVDERDIRQVQADDLRGYTQCHFFAGIGGWPLALQLAGWPTDRPVWTGSCPCQPFSTAGKRKGQSDERHLWPELKRLIKACNPETIFGEQVASSEVVGTQLEAAFLVAVQSGDYSRANKLAKQLVRAPGFHYFKRWIDGIQADLGPEDYTVWPAVLGAHSVGAPHIRQRLFWGADSDGGRCEQRHAGIGSISELDTRGSDGRLVHPNGARPQPGQQAAEAARYGSPAESAGSRLADTQGERVAGVGGECDGTQTTIARTRGHKDRQPVELVASGNAWNTATTIPCADGKSRRVEPGIQLLAHGVPARVVRLRGYGNAILPACAAEFITAYMESTNQEGLT